MVRMTFLILAVEQDPTDKLENGVVLTPATVPILNGILIFSRIASLLTYEAAFEHFSTGSDELVSVRLIGPNRNGSVATALSNGRLE